MKALFLGALIGTVGIASTLPTSGYLTVKKVAEQKWGVGSQVVLPVSFEVKSGYHVQTNPASQPNLIPTTIKIDPSPGISAGAPKYPTGKPYRMQGSEKELSVYDGVFKVDVPVTVDAETLAKRFVLKASVRYQACDEKTCYFPTTVPFEIPVQIVK